MDENRDVYICFDLTKNDLATLSQSDLVYSSYVLMMQEAGR